jgi:hypothetical protein
MYEIDDTPLLLKPESGRWLDRTQIGVDGQSRPIYEPTYSFEIKWGPMDAAQFNQLCGFFAAIASSGTSSIVLPTRCGEAIWTGTTYTEVLFEEPKRDIYWQKNSMRPSMRVRNITA